jgi:hypothetical protein
MKSFLGFRRADWYTKSPSPVPMSMITPSPVGGDEGQEFLPVDLSDGPATDALQHESRPFTTRRSRWAGRSR